MENIKGTHLQVSDPVTFSKMVKYSTYNLITY